MSSERVRVLNNVHKVAEYANGAIRKVPAHSPLRSSSDLLCARTTIKVDDLSHFTVKSYTAFEWGMESTIDRLTLTKAGHTSLVCEFERVADPDENYRYTVHSPEGLVGYMWGRSLYEFDLAIAQVFNSSDPVLNARITETRMGMDERVRDFLKGEEKDARTHKKAHSS